MNVAERNTRHLPGSLLIGLSWAVVTAATACAQEASPAPGMEQQPLLPQIDFDQPIASHPLPESLREISGLAMIGGRLFAHNDELGAVVELDPAEGVPVGSVTLGPDEVVGDFEGVASDGTRLFLVTSGGTFLSFQQGGPGERVPYAATETDLGERCEVEGLAWAPQARLLAVCKTNEEEELEDALRIFAFDPANGRLAPDPVVLIFQEVLASLGVEELSPSGLEVLPNGHLLVVAAREGILLELDAQYRPVAWVELDEDRHRQPEGVAVTPEGQILIADEGGGQGQGLLTRYGPRGGPS